MAAPSGCDCAILLFPRPRPGQPFADVAPDIDDSSGAGGYTHVALECCGPNGEPVAIQAPGSEPRHVHEFDPLLVDRSYGRISLAALGRLPAPFRVECADICARAHKLVEAKTPYSPKRAFPYLKESTRAILERLHYPDDGAFCSDVVTRSIPEVLELILAWLSITHGDTPGVAFKDPTGEIHISPNGLAFALGLPHANSIHAPRTRLEPNLLFLSNGS